MVDTIIVSQGPLLYSQRVENAWKGVLPVIHSTWWGENAPQSLRNVLYSSQPEPGIQNWRLQQKSAVEGLKWAKANGYKKALKIRSDILPTNAAKFVELLEGDLCFLFWHNWQSGYFLDYLQYGEIDTLIDIWSFNEEPPYPEAGITKKVFDLELDKCDIKFVGPQLDKNNDLHWLKNNVFISSYKQDSLYLDKIPK